MNLTIILAVPPPTRAGLQVANDHVDRPLGLLEWAVGVACLRWRRQVVLVAGVLRLRVIRRRCLRGTSIVAAVVVVAT
jgi:hypothetical protein